MKYLAAYAFSIMLLAGCTTTSKYVSKLPAEPKPDDYPIYVYTEDVIVPRASEVIGTMHIGDTPFTVMGGSIESVMNKLMNNARKKGADAVQVTSIKKPSFLRPNHGADANFLRFTDTWESISLSETELKDYFKTNSQKLDPIEGIWRASDRAQTRTAILKNNSRPGREFIAVLLKPGMTPGRRATRGPRCGAVKEPEFIAAATIGTTIWKRRLWSGCNSPPPISSP
ncbi:MAG TPA: hypothetical protein VFZ59_23805 [Verrucomicrobiae bacterium]|nr:hypothetical protein [Verrucomicrobiae bacterium]